MKPVWWAAGAKEYPLSLQTLTALEFLLLGLFELRRYQGWKATKQVLHWQLSAATSTAVACSLADQLLACSLVCSTSFPSTQQASTPRLTPSRRSRTGALPWSGFGHALVCVQACALC